MRPTPTILLIALLPASAVAQQPAAGTYRNPATVGRPTVSPYLNLLRGGSPTLNYYGIVRPEVRIRNQQLRLESQYLSLQNSIGRGSDDETIVNSQLGPTGHTSYFDGGYRFLNTPQPSVDALRIGLIRRKETKEQLGPIEGSRLGATGHFSMSGQDRRFFGQPR